MPRTVAHPKRRGGISSKSAATSRRTAPVRPSVVDRKSAQPFSLEQELVPFGNWVGQPVWVPPKDATEWLAESMYRDNRMMASREQRWNRLLARHRDQFTQVREFELHEASIRLPKGRFYVTVTEREDFDQITDTVPACVQTRLEEFLAKYGDQPGVKVYYIKPLCVEAGNQLIFTTREDLMAAIEQIQSQVFGCCRRLTIARLPKRLLYGGINAGLTVPRALVRHAVRRRQRAVEAYHAKLEFQRRKTALRAARVHRKFRTDGCTFDEMLALTNPLETADVIEQYGIEHELSRAKRNQLLRLAAGSVPWFVALSLTVSYLSSVAIAASATPPVLVCDPAFVAEMPQAKGQLLKIGHFDEVDGVTHVEI